MTTEAASRAATMITDGPGLQSCSRRIGRARVLAHLNIYGEYDRLLGCLQVSYTDVMADGDGKQRAEATIDTAESRRASYYDWGFHRDSCV
jgi:hypothetical protein